MEQLRAHRSAIVTFHDPYVDVIPLTREHADFTGLKSAALAPELLKKQDAVIIITNHDNIDYAAIAKHAPLVIDTRNALAGVAKRGNIVKA